MVKITKDYEFTGPGGNKVTLSDMFDGRRQLITLTQRGLSHAETDRRVRDGWLVQAMQDRYTERERQTINEALSLLQRLSE